MKEAGNDFELRLIGEHKELTWRLGKAIEFENSEEYEKLDDVVKTHLFMQSQAMSLCHYHLTQILLYLRILSPNKESPDTPPEEEGSVEVPYPTDIHGRI